MSILPHVVGAFITFIVMMIFGKYGFLFAAGYIVALIIEAVCKIISIVKD